MEEIWKPVVGCETHKISNLGRVLGPKGFLKGYLKRSKTGRPKCVIVNLSRTFSSKRLHRLVLEAFVGPSPEGFEGCHGDGNPSNNQLSNLRWDTYEANREDMKRHGTAKNPPIIFGQNHPKATLTDAQVLEIRKMNILPSDFSAVAESYRVSSRTIRRIVNGLTRRRAAEAELYGS